MLLGQGLKQVEAAEAPRRVGYFLVGGLRTPKSNVIPHRAGEEEVRSGDTKLPAKPTEGFRANRPHVPTIYQDRPHGAAK